MIDIGAGENMSKPTTTAEPAKTRTRTVAPRKAAAPESNAPHDEWIRFGRGLARARVERLGLSQVKFAQLLQIDPAYVSRIECGRAPGTPGLRVRMAAVLGSSVASLSRGDAPTNGDGVAVNYPNRAMVIASAAFKSAPDAIRDWFISIVRDDGDLSVPGWGSVLAAALQLYDFGLFPATESGTKITSTTPLPPKPKAGYRISDARRDAQRATRKGAR